MWQHAAGIRGDFEILEQVRGRRIGLDRRVEGQRQRPVDQGPPGQVVPVDEGHGHAAATGPAGAADAVKVDVLVLGALIVDHVGHPADVDAAGRHIGGNQNIDLAGSERPQRLLALTLADVAVHGRGGEAAPDKVVDDLVGGASCPHEHDGQSTSLGLQNPSQNLDLVKRVGAENVLTDVRHGAALVRALRRDVDGPPHEPAGQRYHRTRHRRREEQRLADVRDLGEYALDVRQEAEVEHFVGLVENEHAYGGEHQRVLAGQVEQPARGTHDDVHTGAQVRQLWLIGATAVDRKYPKAAACAGPADVGSNLDAQLTGGNDHQGLGTPGGALGPVGHGLHERDGEGEGLAGPGAGLADEVRAGQREGKCQFLDGEGRDDALVTESLDDLFADTEVCETGRRCRGCGHRSHRFVGVREVYGLVVRVCCGFSRTGQRDAPGLL